MSQCRFRYRYTHLSKEQLYHNVICQLADQQLVAHRLLLPQVVNAALIDIHGVAELHRPFEYIPSLRRG